jgi:hypothetical protein
MILPGLALFLAAAPPAAAAIKGADEELLAEVRHIAATVEATRGQKFQRPPIAVRVAEDTRSAAVDIRALNVLSRERLAARGRAWADLGLGGEETPGRLLHDLAADLSGIAFDPQGNRLLVDPSRLAAKDFTMSGGEHDPATVLLWTGVRPDEPLVSHYLTHVRQRERMGRDTLEAQTDACLTASAWGEGEANLVALRHLFAGMGLSDEVLASRIGPADVLDGSLLPAGLSDSPAIERELVRFVYLEGFAAAAERYHKGGWAELDFALSRAKTSRDLLHAGRAALPEWKAEESAPPGDQYRLADRDGLGEQVIVTLIAVLTGKDNLGLQAGDGWAGDAVLRYEPVAGTGHGITEWITHWTSPDEAAEFDYAWGRALAARFPASRVQEVGEGQRVLEAGGRAFRTSRKGDEVRVRIELYNPPPAK